MTRVDRMSELLSILRQQLSGKPGVQRTETSPIGEVDPDPMRTRRVESMVDLRQRLGRELQRYDLSLQVQRKQARRSFVESVLAWDLGEQLPRDPRFNSMIRNVEEAISAHENTSAELDQLIATLRQDQQG